jgi:AmiR/NasT family two-component response regulator
MDGAFQQLRKYARDHNRGITDVAEAIAGGDLKVDSLKPLS